MGTASDFDHISREDITSVYNECSPMDARFEMERGQIARNQGQRLVFEDSEQAGSFIEEPTPYKRADAQSVQTNAFYSTF